MSKQTFTVELDFRGTFQIDVETETANDAYSEAKRQLEEDSGIGEVHVDRIDSFQVMDERMMPQDVTL